MSDETKDSVVQFYDDLAADYHIIFENWHHAVIRQGEALDRIIRSMLVSSDKVDLTLLDCSCGIGTQAIGLAKQGFKVTATDLSSASVDRAKKEADRMGVQLAFGTADFRSLETDVLGEFDVVLSADNAIPHLLTDKDLLLAAQNMYAKVKFGGLLLITLRDYDLLAKEKPRATPPRVFDNGSRIVFQVWDWDEDGKTYITHHFIMQEKDGKWEVKHNQIRYRALLRSKFSQVLTEAGFSDIQWHMPEQSGYYQPVVTARKQGQEKMKDNFQQEINQILDQANPQEVDQMIYNMERAFQRRYEKERREGKKEGKIEAALRMCQDRNRFPQNNQLKIPQYEGKVAP